MLRGSGSVRLGHDLVVRLDDAIDEGDRLELHSLRTPPSAMPLPRGPMARRWTRPSARTSRGCRGASCLDARTSWCTRRLTTADVVVHRGLRLTSAAQTFLDLAACRSPSELVAVGDALMRQGALTPTALAGGLERAGRVRGVVRARACAPLLSTLSMSRPESLMRYWLTVSDLPDPQAQVPVHDRRGSVVARGDLGYPEWHV